jgi:hypothetical protein
MRTSCTIMMMHYTASKSEESIQISIVLLDCTVEMMNMNIIQYKSGKRGNEC